MFEEEPQPNGGRVNIGAYGNTAEATSYACESAPGAFDKLAPADASDDRPTSLNLTWEASAHAQSYEYCYASGNYDDCNWINTGTDTTATISGLSHGAIYYWQVRAINATDITYADGDAEQFWQFTTVSPPSEAPAAGFTAAQTRAASPFTARFADQSTGHITEWTWDFGDGTTLTMPNPQYAYVQRHEYRDPGIYDVTLTVTGPEGSDVEHRTAYIVVDAADTRFNPQMASVPSISIDKGSPMDGAESRPTTLTLFWSKNVNADTYEYCIDTTDDDDCDDWTATGDNVIAELTDLVARRDRLLAGAGQG